MARLRHLIVVLPGIGGSILSRGDAHVWDATPANALHRLVDPSHLAVADDDGVEATGLAGPFGVVPFWMPFPGYHRLLKMLASPFSPGPVVDDGSRGHRNLLADIAAVPYDFRRSIADSASMVDADVRARRDARRAQDRPDRFIVVAHSLGGLVARHWLATSEEAAAGCDHLLTLGTPHQGSPKALDVLVNGVRAAGRTWVRASRLLRTWPSLHELLPRYGAVLDAAPDAGVIRRPYEMALPGVDALLIQRAVAAHSMIDGGWAPGGFASGVTVTPFVGVAQQTCLAARWDGRQLHMEVGTPPWMSGTARFGDATVPDGAATPKEGDNSRSREVACRHGWLVLVDDVAQLVRRVTDPETEPFLGDATAQPAGHVALDLEQDFVVAGELTVARVRLRAPDGAPVGPGVAEPTVRLRLAAPGAAPTKVECIADNGHSWLVEIRSPIAGQYVIEASAPGWLGPEQPPVKELLTVVSAADAADATAEDEAGAA